MIYKFRSKAAGDLILLGPHGDELLRVIGREPAARGIIEPAAMGAAIGALEAAAAADPGAAEGDEHEPRGVSLRQRAWPMIEMLRRAQAAGQPVVWGV